MKNWLAVVMAVVLTAATGCGKPTQSQSDRTLQSYLDAGRERWQQPRRVIQTMGLRAAQTVADIGAGSGYFTYLFSSVVGASGRVYAVDIDPSAVRFLRRRLVEQPPPFPNILVLLSRIDDVTLPPGSLDWAFLCEAHFFVTPGHQRENQECLLSMGRALKPHGQVAVLEVRTDAGRGTITRADLQAPFRAAGLRPQASYDFLMKDNGKGEYFEVFEK